MAYLPARTVAGNLAEDEARIDLTQRLVAEAEPVHHAGTEVGDDDVGLFRHAPDDTCPFLVLQVDDRAAFVAVDRKEVGALAGHERWSVTASSVAVRRLDLDDVGTHITQQHGAHGTGDGLPELQHPHPSQWLLGLLLLDHHAPFN